MPIKDLLLMLRTTGNLTQNESVGPVTVYGGLRQGLAAEIVVPTANGDNDTILPKVYTSADGSTYNLVAQYPKGSVKPTSAGCKLIVPFPPLVGKTYVKVELVATAASTTYNFGAVTVGIVQNPGHDWDRSQGAFN